MKIAIRLLSILSIQTILTGCDGTSALTQVTTDAPQAPAIQPVIDPNPSPSVSPSPSPSPSPSATPYAYTGGGSGTIGDPYGLKLQADVVHIADHPAAYFTVINDIAFSGTIAPLGAFSGVIYGNNFEWDNLKVATSDGSASALFTAFSGTVVNLTFFNAKSQSSGFAAILATNLTGLVSHCVFTGTVTSPSGGNGDNTGVGTPIYLAKAAPVSIVTTTVDVFFNGNRVQKTY